MGLSNLSLKHLATERGHLLMPERMRQLCMGCWPLSVNSFCTSTSIHNFIFFIVVNKSAGDSNLCSQSIGGTPQYSSALNCNTRPFHSTWYAGIHLQFSSVAQLCPTLCDPMNRSMPGLPVHHQLPESTQAHAHQVSDTIRPSHPLSSPPPPAPNPSQHQGLFQWVSSSHQVAKGLEFQLQHQSVQWTSRTDLL